MIKPQTLKGFRDFLPQEARKRQYVINKLKAVFESFGFEPLETPTLEYEEILTGKYGEEGDQLLYRFEDNGKRRVAMRYDQTVPLSRVVAQYQNELPTIFKRYQIQPVWRAENTQKGRYREFLQCDADIIGSSSPLADAEIIATAAKSLEALGFSKFTILMNDRRVFSELITNGFVTKQEMEYAVVAVDKLKKIGVDGVIEELVKKGLLIERAKEMLQLIQSQEKTDTLQDISLYLEDQPKLKAKTIFDPTLARGLNYYSGTIFEIEVEGYPIGSVGGGGRYDNLIGMFAGKQIPAVGFAFGFDRVIEAMDALKLFPEALANSVTRVLVTIFSEETKQKSLEIVSKLRNENTNTELYLGEIKEKNSLEKQLKYANQKQIPYVVIIGPEEAAKNIVTLKNLQTREQHQMTLENVITETQKK
ncbi:MAG TPA: histidine--tRNA ligase [Candidatus Sulfotelmatobacter sp.]|jgi:histidyl-tRNA synthetase|nr:histidine--tRNA ligase [Candidatus Sulfotelmatobacter sp.]